MVSRQTLQKIFKNRTAPLNYNPLWVVKLAEAQIPEETKLIEALKNCTSVIGFCSCGCGDPYFIDPESEDWKFKENIILEREDGIDIILDVMKDFRIGAIE